MLFCLYSRTGKNVSTRQSVYVYYKFFGRDLSLAPVTVIGDTVKDIRCARAFGARVLAVATGSVSLHELSGHEPDILLESLGDVAGVLAQLQLS